MQTLPAPTIPETPNVKVRMSTELLRELATSEGPVRMTALNGPDEEGFYEPVLMLDTSVCPACGRKADR